MPANLPERKASNIITHPGKTGMRTFTLSDLLWNYADTI